MDYLILRSIILELYIHFRKRQKHAANKFFSHPVEVTGSMYFGNIFQLCVSQRYVENLERKCNNSGCIKVDDFCKSVNF